MSDELGSESISPGPPPFPPPRRKGVAWLAWIVILAVVSLIVIRVAGTPPGADEGGHGGASFSLELVKWQARLFVGAGNALKKQDPEAFKNLYAKTTALNQGPPQQRLIYVTVAGELEGPDEASRLADQLLHDIEKHPDEAKPEERQVAAILQRWYNDGWVEENEKQLVRLQLGWFGDLAFTTGQDEETHAKVVADAEVLASDFLQGVTLFTTLVFSGFVVLGLILYLAVRGELQAGLQTGIPHGGVYAETFALWLLVFLGLTSLVSELPGELLINQSIAMSASLCVLAWPIVRGIPWRQVREDIGWNLGRKPLVEPLLGPATYVASLPILAVGVAITMFILFVQTMLLQQAGGEGFRGSSSPVTPHPIVQKLLDSDWLGRIQIFFLASVVAPLVEETMFRGVFHRHLREATRWLSAPISMVISALVASFLFAAIHPTGMIAVPMLMGLALGFTVAREWRGTLIPSMIAHGLSNGLVMWMVILLFGK